MPVPLCVRGLRAGVLPVGSRGAVAVARRVCGLCWPLVALAMWLWCLAAPVAACWGSVGAWCRSCGCELRGWSHHVTACCVRVISGDGGGSGGVGMGWESDGIVKGYSKCTARQQKVCDVPRLLAWLAVVASPAGSSWLLSCYCIFFSEGVEGVVVVLCRALLEQVSGMLESSTQHIQSGCCVFAFTCLRSCC
jgi:hypothetical protein